LALWFLGFSFFWGFLVASRPVSPLFSGISGRTGPGRRRRTEGRRGGV